ncbi:hypothetical protein ACIA48_05270 [Mycobacterium sp. NPDC051804]|uniref:hypothetical protein n=1 Tax=Mycobacterium sp. NPDC051804 TaxID=3364295 RepID=UPI0037953C03
MSLSEAERSHILASEIASLPGGLYGTVDHVSGNISIRNSGPVVTKRGRTWAEVTYDTPLTHPAYIMLQILFSVLTCGLYIPWWFYKTFKRPGVWTLSIDEDGAADWTQHEITGGQRVQRYLLLAVLIAFLAFWVVGIVGYLAGVEVDPADYRGY